MSQRQDGRLIPYLDQLKSMFFCKIFAQCELLSLADYDPNPSWTERIRSGIVFHPFESALPRHTLLRLFIFSSNVVLANSCAFPAFFLVRFLFLIIKYNRPRLGQIAKQLDNLFVKKFSVVFGDLAASTWYLKALLEAILMQIPRHGEWYNYHHQALESVLGQSLF